jgi:hypothetical protein
MIIIDPAFAFFQTKGAAITVVDFALGQINDIQLKSFLSKGVAQHFDHHGCIARSGVGRAIQSNNGWIF